jgi:hypothetical protein
MSNDTGLSSKTHEERCTKTRIETLQKRRERQDMAQFFKMSKID